ncbi:MAG: hypothetical protein ABSD75_07590 [Terriglobales bacterium]|jgi:hypothetical protein
MSAAKTAFLVVDVQRGILAIPKLARKNEIDRALDDTVLRIAGLIREGSNLGRARDLPPARWGSWSPTGARNCGVVNST